MILNDCAGEIAVSAGDCFTVHSGGGQARLEVLYPDWTLGSADAPLICCRVVEGRLAVFESCGFLLGPQAIVYYRSADVAAARRAFLASADPRPIPVQYLEAR